MPERPTTSWPQRLHSTAEYDLLQPSAWKKWKWKWKWKILPFSFFGFQHRGFLVCKYGIFRWANQKGVLRLFSLEFLEDFSQPPNPWKERERERERKKAWY